jgi:hypothetical protein
MSRTIVKLPKEMYRYGTIFMKDEESGYYIVDCENNIAVKIDNNITDKEYNNLKRNININRWKSAIKRRRR